jgi:hypothetical protein
MKLLPSTIVLFWASAAQACLECHGVPDFGAHPTSIATGGELSVCAACGPDAVVLVPAGVTVIVTNPTEVHTLAVAGTVVTSGTLRVVNLLGYEGSAWKAVDGADIVIRDVAPTDPNQWGTGVIWFGSASLKGATRVPFIRALGDLSAGAQTLMLQHPDDWQAGDELVVPDVRQMEWQDRRAHDRRRIVSIDEGVATLDAPLSRDRIRPRHVDGRVLAEIPIINLTRGIRIHSENPQGTRGHLAFLHRADVRAYGVECCDMGRTQTRLIRPDEHDHAAVNQLGRYQFHLHHVLGPERSHNSFQWEIDGCCCHDGIAQGWDFTIHQTHFGRMTRCVAWSPLGSTGIATEDGPEWKNEFIGNLSGGQLAPFWLIGVRNTVRGNLIIDAADGLEFGDPSTANPLWGYPPAPGVEKTAYAEVREKEQVPLDFSDNEFWCCDRVVRGWQTGTTIISPDQPADYVLRRSRSYFQREGIQGYKEHNVRLEDWLFHTDKDLAGNQDDDSFGFGWSGRTCLKFEADNCTAIGFKAGVYYRPRDSGSRMRISNCEFHCRNGVTLRMLRQQPEFGDVELVLDNCRFHGRGMPNDGAAIDMSGPPSRSFWISHRVYVRDFNGVAGDSFQAFWNCQAPDFPIPRSRSAAGSLPQPGIAGLTNQEAWDQFQTCVGGAVAPQQTRPEVLGFVQPIDDSGLPIP